MLLVDFVSKIRVRCGYCGQLAKESNCGYYKRVLMHNTEKCNCLQAAIKSNFQVKKPHL